MNRDRRSFLKIGAGASIGVLTTKSVLSNQSDKSSDVKIKNGKLMEPKRAVTVVNQSDVIVCGGGPAGFAAALNAARQGAKTTLIEMYGFLGGIWTVGLLSNIIDHKNKSGIMSELIHRLEGCNARMSDNIFDTEMMKYTLEQMCLEAGVDIRLHTKIVSAYRNSKNKLEYIVTESFSGREAWKGNVFIDATGNGDLGALAGCSFDYGHPDSGIAQPMTLMAVLVGLKKEELVANGFMDEIKNKTVGKSKLRLHEEIKRGGVDASYTMPGMAVVGTDMISLGANHQYNVSSLDASQITKATLDARKEINKIVNGLRSLGGIWSNVRIAVTGSQIGIRGGRRINGLYKVSQEDIMLGSKFEDAVCKATFTVDVHSLEKKTGGGYGSHGIKVKPYNIPLRSLIAKDVDGLMMAGRCISGDFFAHASYRVTGNAVPMGEAAGYVAAKAAMDNKLPQYINFKSIS